MMDLDRATIGIIGATGIIGASFLRELGGKAVLTLGRQSTADRQLDMDQPINADLFSGIDLLIFAAGIRDEDMESSHTSDWRLNQGQRQFLEAIGTADIRGVINVSTAHVYGPMAGKIDENTLVSPQSPYARAHASMEQGLEELSRDGGLSVLNLRPNAVYGQDMGFASLQRPQLIPYLFPRMAAATGKLTIKMPSVKRNFVSANHVAACAIQEIQKVNPGEARILNPVGAKMASIGEFAQMVAQKTETVLNKPVEVVAENESPVTDFEYGSIIPQRDTSVPLDAFLENYLRYLGSYDKLTNRTDKEKSNAAG